MSYLGKISAIVSANTGDFVSKLAASGKEVASWARSLEGNINKASSGAASSLRNIYTEAQKLERSLQAAKGGLKFKGIDAKNVDAAVSRMQALFSATRMVNEPLARAARTLEKLPAGLQGGFLEAMKRAQSQAERLTFEINKLGEGTVVTGSALEKKFESIARRAQMTADSVERLKEAAGAVSGLATGNEMRFRNPEFASEMARARSLQERAAATQGGNFSAIIQRQAAAANELAAAFARMEESRLVVGGDVAGATAAYERQLVAVQQIGNELEYAITASQAGAAAERERAANMQRAVEVASTMLNVLQQESTLLSNQGAATDVSGRLRAAEAIQRAAQEEAAYRERAAEQAEREAAVLAQVVQLQNRAFVLERDRRSGTLARNNSAAFDAATEELMRAPPTASANIFGPQARTIETELNRTRELYQTFISLAPEVRTALEAERQALNNIATGARDGAVSIGVLTTANDRMAQSMREQSRAAEIARQEAALGGNLGASSDVAAGRAAARAAEIARQEAALGRNLGATSDVASGRVAAQRNAIAREFAGGLGGMGAGGINLGIDERSLRAVGTQLEYLQGRLAGLGATARGPVVAAMERVRQVAVTGFRDGTIGTQAFDQQLRNATNDLTRVAAAALNIRPQRLAEQLRRVGDIARGSFGNLGLAVQQAAFAVDDFFSVTGGLDQRIRAAGNNISQLAFIIGQTRGLIIGIAISIGAQLVAALIKWANKGRTAEDQLKALNDAMKRQKQLAMELADAFDTLGESIVDRMFADGENQIRKFNKSLEDLIKKQKEARQEFLGELNPTLVGNRTRQATIERQLASEKTDLTERMRLQQELDRLRREEKEFMAAPNAQLSGVQEALEKAFEGYLQDQGYDASPERRQDARDMAQQAMDEVIRGAGSPEEAIAIIRELKQKLGTMQGSILFPGRSDRDAGLAALEQLERVVTQNAVASKTDAGIISFVNALSDAQVSISAAQELLQGFEFSPLRKEIIDTANKMDAAKNAIVEAERAYQESTTKTIEEAQARDAVVAEQNKVIEGLKEQAAAQRAAAESVKNLDDVMKRISGNLDDVMKRISGDLVNTVEGEARSLADSARREANRATAQAEWGPDFDQSGQRVLQDDLWFNAEFAQERRRDAEVAARKIEEMAISAREEQERLRIEFEQSMAGDPEVMRKRARLQELQAVLDDKNSTEDEKRAASLEKEDILRQQRIRFEGSPQGREAAKQADWVNQAIEEQRARFMQEDGEVMAARRGRDIGLRDGVLAARDAANAIKDIAQARNLQMLDTDPDGFIVGRARRNEILADAQASEFARQQMRSAAPAIFEMADAVTNAVLQGPSRQALEVSDVSTMEGSRELNRLLRGDDASKNANLVELQKQNATLSEMLAALRDAAQNAGIVLDLRG